MKKTNKIVKMVKCLKNPSFFYSEKLFGLILLLLLTISSPILAQTYTASPSSWTSQPSNSVYWENSGQTFRATTDDKKTWIEARAVVNNTKKTITFSFRKNSGTFKIRYQAGLSRILILQTRKI